MAGKHSDDEDAYLYGSDDDNDQPVSKKQKITEQSDESQEKLSKTTAAKKSEVEEKDSLENSSNDEDDNDSEEDSDSDDDIEFVIGESAPKSGQTITTSGPQNDTIDAVTDMDAGGDKNATTTIVSNQADKGSSIDINSVAQLDGKPLHSSRFRET